MLLKVYLNVLVASLVLIAGLLVIYHISSTPALAKEDENNETKISNTNVATGNNTIILNPQEINETYRWINSSGGINPTLGIVKGSEYLIKIKNPTDKEHELIIEDAKHSEIGTSKEIQPGKNTEFKFNTEKTGQLNYYCKYHPETMRGIININENP
jgi:Cupredoxin-like domain